MGIRFPQTEVTVGGNMAGWELVLLVAVVGATLVGLTWPLLRSWARRLDSRPLEPLLASRLDQLEALTHQVETLQARVVEMDQRLEFAERLLQRPPAEP